MKKRDWKRTIVVLAGFFFLLCMLQSCQKENNNVVDNPSPQPPVPSPPAPVSMVLTAATRSINDKIGGYYFALPSNYSQTSHTYPLLVYMHGAGQFGNGNSDLPLLLKDGVAQVINDKKFPGSFTVNNQTFSFIVLMPQAKNFPGTVDINDCIELAKKSWRIDASRIYLSGLSAGSMVSCDFAADNTSKIAALVPMAGVPGDYASTNKCQKLVAGHLPVWVFHCQDDPQVDISTAKGFVAKMTSLNPDIPPKLTIWPNGGHDAWTRAVNPSYKENGMNIYEWMLQYHR
jgi:predicted peptidase